MEHISHQTMIMQFILELSKSLKIDPRQCVRPFFTRLEVELSLLLKINESFDLE